MNQQDVRPGMKVVPHSKTVHGFSDLGGSWIWMDAKEIGQPYLYIIEWESGNNCWVLSGTDDGDGDFFNASDFEPYVETTS